MSFADCGDLHTETQEDLLGYGPASRSRGSQKDDSGNSEDGSSADTEATWEISNIDALQLIPLETSTYGAFIYSYCRLATHRHDQFTCIFYFKMMYAMLLHILSIGITVLFVFLLFATSIEYQEDRYEVDLPLKTEILQNHLNAGVRINMTTADSLTKSSSELCYMDKTKDYTHALSVFVFVMRMIPEVMEAVWLFAAVRLTHHSHQTRVTTVEKKNLVSGITTRGKIILSIMAPLLKLIVSLIVTYVGSKQIIMNHTTFRLVMQVVGITYIIQMDDWFFQAFFGLPFQEKVKNTFLAMPKIGSDMRRFECLGPAKFLSTILITVFLWHVVFYDLANFREVCHLYRERFPPIDKPWNYGLWILGMQF